MAIIKQESFDYAFDTNACALCKGKCCTGERGYIWVDEAEILAFADFFSIKRDEFVLKYLERINFRYTLKEVKYKDGHACIFFDEEIMGCKVYNIRPHQCCTFPFWEYFKNHKRELEDECIGILSL